MQRGGGFIIAASVIVGAGIGVVFGESSIGIIAGFVVGAIGAGVLAWQDARRKR